jgi:hypothetical protein
MLPASASAKCIASITHAHSPDFDFPTGVLAYYIQWNGLKRN